MEPLDYDQLAAQVLDRGGFTVNITTGQTPVAGFAVSTRPDAAESINLGPRTTRRDVADRIYSYVVQHGSDLRGRYHLGAWRDDDQIILDLVRIYRLRSIALKRAWWADQTAIYDLSTGTVINVRDALDDNRQHGLDDIEDAWAQAEADARLAEFDDDPDPYSGTYSEE